MEISVFINKDLIFKQQCLNYLSLLVAIGWRREEEIDVVDYEFDEPKFKLNNESE